MARGFWDLGQAPWVASHDAMSVAAACNSRSRMTLGARPAAHIGSPDAGRATLDYVDHVNGGHRC
jgi:hypothetical protein